MRILKYALIALFIALSLESGYRAFKIWSFSKNISSSVLATVRRVEVIEGKKAPYQIRVHFAYAVAHRHFQGVSLLDQPLFERRVDALRFGEALEKEPIALWLSPDRPWLTSFSRPFPFRELLLAFAWLSLTLLLPCALSIYQSACEGERQKGIKIQPSLRSFWEGLTQGLRHSTS